MQAFVAGPCSAPASLERLLEQYPVSKQLWPQHCYAIIRGCLSRFGTVPALLDLPGMQQLDTIALAELIHHAVSTLDWKGAQTLSALPAAAELSPVALRAVLGTVCSVSELSTETFVTLLSLPPAQDIPKSALWDLFLSAAAARDLPHIQTLQDMLPEAAQLYCSLTAEQFEQLFRAAGAQGFDEALLWHLLQHPHANFLTPGVVGRLAVALAGSGESRDMVLKLQALPAMMHVGNDCLSAILQEAFRHAAENMLPTTYNLQDDDRLPVHLLRLWVHFAAISSWPVESVKQLFEVLGMHCSRVHLRAWDVLLQLPGARSLSGADIADLMHTIWQHPCQRQPAESLSALLLGLPGAREFDAAAVSDLGLCCCLQNGDVSAFRCVLRLPGAARLSLEQVMAWLPHVPSDGVFPLLAKLPALSPAGGPAASGSPSAELQALVHAVGVCADANILGPG